MAGVRQNIFLKEVAKNRGLGDYYSEILSLLLEEFAPFTSNKIGHAGKEICTPTPQGFPAGIVPLYLTSFFF